MKHIESKEDFRQWLAQQPSDRLFARNSSCGCPLAIYSDCRTTRYYYHMRTLSAPTALPEWAVVFISFFDSGNNPTAAGALATLKKVDKCLL